VQTIGSVEAEVIAEGPSAEAIGFPELAELARPALVRAAHAVTGCKQDAEDAVQTSLLKAMAAWPRVAGQESWRQQAYVRQIVVNTCRSNWRKWGSRVVVGDMPEQVQAAGTDSVEDRELVRQALGRLPARQREVLLLRYYQDLSEAEIARRLGCAPGTVKSSAARALRALRDLLPEYAGAPAPPLPDAWAEPSEEDLPAPAIVGSVVASQAGQAGPAAGSEPETMAERSA
jgi:RNA polymerase sigma-70 factor (sigma-E family)